MPIANIQDAQEVEHSLQAVLTASDIAARTQAIRALFVETWTTTTPTSGCPWDLPATTNCLTKPTSWHGAMG